MSKSDFIVCSMAVVSATICILCYYSEGKVTDASAFPWFCLVVHQNHLVSTCTIIRDTFVVVSVDNLNQQIPSSSKYYYQVIGELVITAGEEASKSLDPDYYQVRSPTKFYGAVVGRNSKITQIFENPDELGGVVNDVFGEALNVGLLWFNDPFKWSEFVKAAPLFDSAEAAARNNRKINDFLDQTELELADQTPCIVASWKTSTHAMEMFEVIFVPEQSCRESYCAYDQNKCLNFPKRPYLMCFKSLTFRDMCPKDRGAALVCNHFNEKVIGILTTAINCGYKNLPPVYTSAEIVQKLLNKVVDPGS